MNEPFDPFTDDGPDEVLVGPGAQPVENVSQPDSTPDPRDAQIQALREENERLKAQAPADEWKPEQDPRIIEAAKKRDAALDALDPQSAWKASNIFNEFNSKVEEVLDAGEQKPDYGTPEWGQTLRAKYPEFAKYSDREIDLSVKEKIGRAGSTEEITELLRAHGMAMVDDQ